MSSIERQVQRARERQRWSRANQRRFNGETEQPPRNADKADPPAEDKTVPAGRNASELKSRPNPPVDETRKPEEQKKQEQELREVSFAKHVSTHVSKQKNGLHGQLESGAKNRLKLRD